MQIHHFGPFFSVLLNKTTKRENCKKVTLLFQDNKKYSNESGRLTENAKHRKESGIWKRIIKSLLGGWKSFKKIRWI